MRKSLTHMWCISLNQRLESSKHCKVGFVNTITIIIDLNFLSEPGHETFMDGFR